MQAGTKKERALINQQWVKHITATYMDDIVYSIDHTYIESEIVKDGESRRTSLPTKFIVSDLSTELYTALAIIDNPDKKVGVLNFASFLRPGGGFISGADAQEESLCRYSTLYPVLHNYLNSFYKENVKLMRNVSPRDVYLYKNRALVSEQILFCYPHMHNFSFSDISRDQFRWILKNAQNPAGKATVITCAAPNKGEGLRQREPISTDYIDKVLDDRIYFVLLLAQKYKIEHLILGAFGCGVFKNNPYTVFDIFRNHLNGDFKNVFHTVAFAVPKITPTDKKYYICKAIFKEEL